MDTSKEYIKMCEKAEEIQTPKHLFEEGDFMHQLKVVDGKPYYIWLPRQDQLQEVVGKHYLRELIRIFTTWWDMNWQEHPEFSSMEQLWLAFVMKEKYNKTWDGENWKEPHE